MMNRRKRILWLLLVCLIMLSACGKEGKQIQDEMGARINLRKSTLCQS